MPPSDNHGHTAESPGQIPGPGWRDILWRTKDEIGRDHVSVVSAGVAFFGLLAIFPAIGALVSIAGFVLDPQDVAAQLDSLVALLPENAAAIIQDQIVKVTGGDEAATGFAALFGILLALYGAMKGMKTLMEGMNIAYDEVEERSFVMLNLTAFLLTLFLILGMVLAFGAIMILPAITAFMGLPEGVENAISWLKWPLLTLLTIVGLAVLYRYGPSRAEPKWRWVSVGSVVATALWMIGTVAFSVYAQNFGSYNETYGTLGGVIILLTWLWLSSFIVLAGAELNSEIEHQTAKDSTTGAPVPRGQRGAVKADTLQWEVDKDDRSALHGSGAGTKSAGSGHRTLPRTDRPVATSRPGMIAAAGLLGLLAYLRSQSRPPET